jgi:O-antigen ligase
VATYASDAAVGLSAPQPSGDARTIAWVGVVAAILVAVLGSLEGARTVMLISAVIALAIGAILAPQIIFALFLVAAGIKASPTLAVVPFDLTVATGAAVLLAMIARAMSPAQGVPRVPPATVLALLLSTLALLSVMWSPAPARGLDLALRFETLTMIALFAPLILVRSRAELVRLAVALVALSTAIALTAVHTGNVNTPLTIAGSKDEIDVALYTSLGVFAAIGYLVLTTRHIWRFLWFVPAGICASTIVQSGSRGVLIAASVALLVAAAFAIARARLRILAALGVAVAIVAVALAAPQLAGRAGKKYQQELFSGNTAQVLGKRDFLLRYGADLAIAHPMGLGIAGYQAVTGYIYPHNALLEAADEEGILGLGLLLALILAAWRSARRAWAGRTSPEAVFAATLLVVMVGEAMFSTSFTQNRLMWFALGLAFAVPRIPPTRAARSELPTSGVARLTRA